MFPSPEEVLVGTPDQFRRRPNIGRTVLLHLVFFLTLPLFGNVSLFLEDLPSTRHRLGQNPTVTTSGTQTSLVDPFLPHPLPLIVKKTLSWLSHPSATTPLPVQTLSDVHLSPPLPGNHRGGVDWVRTTHGRRGRPGSPPTSGLESETCRRTTRRRRVALPL